MTLESAVSALAEFDTPSVSNVVATYPDDPLCLGLYNPWREDWYTDHRLECLYPEHGPRCGVAVTCTYGVPDPNYGGHSFMDVVDAMDDAPSPTILALHQDFRDDVAGKVGLTGGNMTSAMRAVDCVGCVTDGPARDVEEVRPLGVQYLVTGVSPAHGEMAVQAVNTPVTLRGMAVAPGEVVHMDVNGAVKFPAEHAEAVLRNVRALEDREAELQAAVSDATSADEVRAAFAGDTYGDDA